LKNLNKFRFITPIFGVLPKLVITSIFYELYFRNIGFYETNIDLHFFSILVLMEYGAETFFFFILALFVFLKFVYCLILFVFVEIRV
jgi:hypothetical protein